MSDKTEPYLDSSDKTQPYEQSHDLAEATQPYETEGPTLTDKTVAHNLGIGDKIELDGKAYEILEIISGDDVTGEAVIYKIEDNFDQYFSLKLYYQFHNPKDEPNPEALRRITAIEDPDILKLYDFGTGIQKFQNRFCFEICQFAEGGNLLSVEDLKQKYTPEFLRSNVIPEIFKGIKRLHENNIYHCDLKPQNVFYLDKEQTDLIIGDYGSAKTFEHSSEKDLAQTSIAKGTDFYLAPEQARGIISEKNDYYSLGIIVLHLVYPKQVSKSSLRKIIERQFSGKPIIDFDAQFEDLNYLIAGLTLQDINKRWARNEIERWLAAEKVEVEYPSRGDVVPIKLGTVTIRTEEELTNYVETDATWYDNLIEDSEGYGMLLTWLSNLQDLERKRVFDRMIRYYQQDGKEYVKEAILRYFVPERPVRVEMKSYNFWGEKKLNELVDSFIKHLDDIWKITKLEDLKFYVFQFEFCLRQLESVATGELKTQIRATLEKVSAVLNVSPKEDFSDYQAVLYPELTDERLIELFYAFNDKRAFKDINNSPINNIEQVGFYFARHEELFENRHMKHEKEYYLKELNGSALANLDYREFLFQIFKDEIKTHIEFEKLAVAKNRHYKIHYSYQKSLAEFFQAKGIQNNLKEESTQSNTFSYKKKFNDSFETVFSKFLDHVQEAHDIDVTLITEKNKTEFFKKFKKKALKQYSILQTSLFSITSMIIGITIGVFFSKYYNSELNPLRDYNLISPILLSFWLGFTTFFIGLSIALRKQNAIRMSNFYNFLVALNVVLIFWWIFNKQSEADKIFKFRQDFYLNSYFDIPNTGKTVTIPPDKTYTKGLNYVKMRVRRSGRLKYLSLQASCYAIESSYSKDTGGLGFLTPDYYKRTVKPLKVDESGFLPGSYYRLYATYLPLGRTNTFKQVIGTQESHPVSVHDKSYSLNQYLAFHVSFKARTNATEKNDNFGLSFNQYAILFNAKEVAIYSLEAPQYPKNENHTRYYVVSGNRERKSLKYTRGHTQGGSSASWGAVHSEPSYSHLDKSPDKKLFDKKEIENWQKGFNQIDIVFLKNKFFIKVNDVKVLNRKIQDSFWRPNLNFNKDFGWGIGLLFEPYAKFDITSVSITQLREPMTPEGRNHRFVPLQADALNDFEMLKTLEGELMEEATLKNGDIVEVLYSADGYTKIRFNDKFGFCKNDDLGPLKWQEL